MACEKCNHKGYVETFISIHDGYKPSIQQCRNCNDLKAYSDEVQKRLSRPYVPGEEDIAMQDEPSPPRIYPMAKIYEFPKRGKSNDQS